jgi:fibronectin-binding autotransporter adhesin
VRRLTRMQLPLRIHAASPFLAPRGAGIGVDSPGAPQTLISGCQIDHNNANGKFQGGGGISVGTGSVVSIQGSTVTQNVSFAGGGGIFTDGVTLALTNTTVKDNVGGQICDNNTGCQ